MAEFTKTIPAQQTVSGTFRAKLNQGDTITLTVDCAGMLTCTDCGINLRADANETNEEGEIIGVSSVSGTATATGTFLFNYSAYNETGPGHITASGFESVIEPFSVAPTSISFDKAGGTQSVSVSGSVKSLSAKPSASWISEDISGIIQGVSVSENSSIRRGGYIVITATMTDDTIETATINVAQAGETLKIVPTVWNVGNGGGARTLSVSPNDVALSISSGTAWATYSNKAIRAAANTGGARSATFYGTASAPESTLSESVEIVVNQESGESGAGGNSGSGSGGSSGESGSGGSSGTDTGAAGNTTPSGATGNGGRVGTVIFRNAKGATLHYIITQNP